jgi:hypothetical protein
MASFFRFRVLRSQPRVRGVHGIGATWRETTGMLWTGPDRCRGAQSRAHGENAALSTASYNTVRQGPAEQRQALDAFRSIMQEE